MVELRRKLIIILMLMLKTINVNSFGDFTIEKALRTKQFIDRYYIVWKGKIIV